MKLKYASFKYFFLDTNNEMIENPLFKIACVSNKIESVFPELEYSGNIRKRIGRKIITTITDVKINKFIFFEIDMMLNSRSWINVLGLEKIAIIFGKINHVIVSKPSINADEMLLANE